MIIGNSSFNSLILVYGNIQVVRDYANRALADRPFTTCLVLMGSGAVVGIIATLIVFFCSKVSYDE